jgi:hypothetical protein
MNSHTDREFCAPYFQMSLTMCRATAAGPGTVDEEGDVDEDIQ